MSKIFMSGIGGIGMSALAQLLKERGDTVIGSDRAESPVVNMLRSKDIEVIIGQEAKNIPPDTDIVVYTSAVPDEHPERVEAARRNLPQLSYFEMLGVVSEGRRTIAIAGTHGKTTTTGMLTRILLDAGASPTAVIGSLVTDLGSNYVSGTSELFVVEACEYQRHFLTLTPEILVITNVEYDHTDYFTDLADVQRAFRTMMEKVPTHGAIVTDTEHPNIAPLLEGLSPRIINYTSLPPYALRLPGEFNIMNARAAAAAAKAALPSIPADKLSHALYSFTGTWRRFEHKGMTALGATVYDDYAHHPTEIRETLRALKKLRDTEGGGRIIVAFHPHLFSRTRDLLDGFARAFADADEAIIAPIFAAREDDDGSVSNEILAAHIRDEGTSARAATLEETETLLRAVPKGDIIMTMGAGDIYKIADALVH